MPTMLGVAFQGASFFKATRTAFAGSGTTDLYGALLREPNDVNTVTRWEYVSSLCAQLGAEVYLLVTKTSQTPRVYKAYDGAVKLILSADPTGGGTPIPLSGETITQAVSGATGTLVEDYRVGDDFIIVDAPSGTFDAVNSCTFSTATSSTTPTSVEDNGGEFAIDWESANTLQTNFTASSSGFAHGLKNEKPTLGFAYIDNVSNGNIWSVVRNPSSGLWEENDSLVNSTQQWRKNGSTLVHRNSVYWTHQLSSSDNVTQVVTMNIGTGACSVGTIFPGSNTRSNGLVVWNGRVFCGVVSSTSSLELYELVGASAVKIADLGTGGIGWVVNEGVTPWVGRDDNALYFMTRNSGSKNQVVRFYLDSNGDIVISCPPSCQNNNVVDISGVMLPSAIRSGVAADSHGVWLIDTDSVPATPATRIWFYNGSQVAGTEYKWTNFIDLDSGLTATVSGTIGSANDLVFQNTVAGSLAVGDWVWIKTLGSAFRVAAVATVNVQLENHTPTSSGGTALVQPTPPAGTSIIGKAQVMSTESGTEAGLTGVALPYGDLGGGKVHTPGEIFAEFNAQDPAVGGVAMTFTIFDPFSNSAGGDLTARGWWMKEDGTYGQMTLLSVGQGTKTGDTNTALSAGTLQTFVWDAPGDGITDGEFTRKTIEIEKV
tara:strand:- start:206 stop:2176 length:1971 start_codon:yes stop_codon:yes gene_type:complete